MKIIETPSAQPWAMKHKCGTCHTLVEIEIGDFQRRVSDQRDGDAAVFPCPTCKREQWIDTSLIPTHLHHRLPR